MYYYVLESPSSRAVRQSYQRLRDLLTNFGIAGEMVTASPARTPTELAQMGISKGYSTIVAVGSDAHINEVSTSILGRAVLGIVPINASELVTDLTGYNDLKGAAEALKQRKLSIQPTVFIEPETLLFLDGTIESQQLAKITVVCDNRARIHAYFNRLTINRQLEIDLESTHVTEARKVFGFFQVGGQSVLSKSHFHGKNVRIVTDPILPLTVAGSVVAQTPLQLKLVPESLKLITKRGTVLE